MAFLHFESSVYFCVIPHDVGFVRFSHGFVFSKMCKYSVFGGFLCFLYFYFVYSCI